MSLSAHIDFSAHAYLVRGSGGVVQVNELLNAQDISTVGNPDCYTREFEAFSVDDARDIASFAYFKPVGDRKFIVVGARSMTVEAQNALLKIVEEGSGSSIFFFVLEPGVPVLPTLESRCVVVKEQGVKNGEQGEEFLALSYKDRLALAEKFAKNHDRDGARSLVRSLLELSEKKKFSASVLRDLLDADRYLKLSGSSPKGVVGHLALVM